MTDGVEALDLEYSELTHFRGQPENPGRKVKGWGRGGTLTTGDGVTKVQVAGGNGDGQSYTVQITAQRNPASNVPIVTQALIAWSAGGVSSTRRVTVGNGVSISGCGEQVKVTVSDATIAVGASGPPNAQAYDVAILITPGVRAATPQPPTFQPVVGFFVVPTVTTQDIAIPADAGITSVAVTCDAPDGSVMLEGACQVQHSSAGILLKSYDPRDYAWVPIAPGADKVSVKNLSGVNQNWSILFGVDG